MNTIEEINLDAEALEAELVSAESSAVATVETAGLVKVESASDYEAASLAYAAIKRQMKELEQRRVAITGPINASLSLINEGFKKPKQILEQSLKLYERPMLAFQQEQDRIRKEEERKVRQQQEQLAKEAAEKLAKEKEALDLARLAAEEAAELASNAQDPLDALAAEEEARKARLQAEEQRAALEARIRASAMQVTTTVPNLPAKVTATGSRVQRPWKHRVVDFAKLPDTWKLENEKALAAHARTMKDKAQVPGVEFYQDMTITGA